MQDETDHGKGTLGPIGSFARNTGQLAVEFEALYRYHATPRKGSIALGPHIECVELSIVACDGRDIPSGVYYFHADHDGQIETMRVSNLTGEWQRLSRCS
jgi:hypothetical protein